MSDLYPPGKYLLFQGAELPEDFIDIRTGTALRALGPLGRVNILVGANSAGKSRLTRDLVGRSSFAMAEHETIAAIERAIEIAKEFERRQVSLQLRRNPHQTILLEAHTFREAAATMTSDIAGKDPGGTQRDGFNRFAVLAKAMSESNADIYNVSGAFDEGMLAEATQGISAVERIERPDPPRLLVPALRSSHTLWLRGDDAQDAARFSIKNELSRLHEDIHAATVRHRYFTPNTKVKIWTGAKLYDELLAMQCAQRAERAKKDAFERLLGRTFFGGRSVELFAQLASAGKRANAPFDAHVEIVVDGEELPLFKVGDGVGAVTVLLYPLFTADEGTWAFVEEPENHLHPAYQRVFLETLLRDEALRRLGLHVFVTTHSNHLLDIAMEYPDEISVFSLSRLNAERKVSVRRSQGRDIRTLDALGVRNSSVYLANCSIWVEGPSDVTYIRAYLDALGKRPDLQEDLNYAFIEYGGSLLANYVFDDEEAPAEQIEAAASANRLCLVADFDSEKKRAKHEKWHATAAKSEGALEYVVTTGREIENEMSDDLLRRVVARLLGVSEHDLPELVVPLHDPLGPYLESAFAESEHLTKVQRWRRKDGDALTAAAKRAFSSNVAEAIASEPDVIARTALIGERARTLGQRVLAFIERHNGNGVPRTPAT